MRSFSGTPQSGCIHNQRCWLSPDSVSTLISTRQVSKLPDWAIVDLKTPPSSRYPGAIPTAGFFDEQWKLTLKDRPID